MKKKDFASPVVFSLWVAHVKYAEMGSRPPITGSNHSPQTTWHRSRPMVDENVPEQWSRFEWPRPDSSRTLDKLRPSDG